MRKFVLILAALAFCSQLFAVPHFRPRPRFRHRHHRPPSISKTLRKVPWKTIVAGGAAGGGIIFAYKVADGIETGIETAAAREPQGFLHELGSSARAFQVICILCVLASVAYFIWRIRSKEIKSSARDMTAPLTEVVETVAMHQAAGSSPSTSDNVTPPVFSSTVAGDTRRPPPDTSDNNADTHGPSE